MEKDPTKNSGSENPEEPKEDNTENGDVYSGVPEDSKEARNKKIKIGSKILGLGNGGEDGGGGHNLYKEVAPFHFPDTSDYKIFTKKEYADYLGVKSVADYELGLKNQKSGDNRILYFLEKFKQLTPDISDFKKDPGRDFNRVEDAKKMESRIRDSHAQKSNSKENNDEEMDFAIECLIYEMTENGLFSCGEHKAIKVFTSDFDDYINVSNKEEAHATDCAFLIPIPCSKKEGGTELKHFPLAIAMTTSGKPEVIREKLDKYPKHKAYVEFAQTEKGKHLEPRFMPVVVLGFDHSKVRSILSSYDDLSTCLTDEIKHNFYVQIYSQCALRMLELREEYPDLTDPEKITQVDKEIRNIYRDYKLLYSRFLAMDNKIKEERNWDNNKPIKDRSAGFVLSIASSKIRDKKNKRSF